MVQSNLSFRELLRKIKMELPNLRIKTFLWHGIPVNVPESRAGWVLYFGIPLIASVLVIALALAML